MLTQDSYLPTRQAHTHTHSVGYSRHGDAGLSYDLGAQVFGGELEGSVQQTQVLVETVVLCRPGDQ